MVAVEVVMVLMVVEDVSNLHWIVSGVSGSEGLYSKSFESNFIAMDSTTLTLSTWNLVSVI